MRHIMQGMLWLSETTICLHSFRSCKKSGRACSLTKLRNASGNSVVLSWSFKPCSAVLLSMHLAIMFPHNKKAGAPCAIVPHEILPATSAQLVGHTGKAAALNISGMAIWSPPCRPACSKEQQIDIDMHEHEGAERQLPAAASRSEGSIALCCELSGGASSRRFRPWPALLAIGSNPSPHGNCRAKQLSCPSAGGIVCQPVPALIPDRQPAD